MKKNRIYFGLLILALVVTIVWTLIHFQISEVKDERREKIQCVCDRQRQQQ